MRDITDPEFQKVCGMNSFHGTMNSFHGGMNSGTRWNEFIPGGMNSFYSRNPYTVYLDISCTEKSNHSEIPSQKTRFSEKIL